RAAPKVPPPYRPPAQPVAAQRSPANVPRASIAHAHTPPSPQGRLKAAAAAAIQRYEVLPPARIHQHAPDWSFSLEYPYAVVGNAPFNAQAKAVGVGGVNKFLTGAAAHAANVVNAGGGLSLRVSSSGAMAIEDSTLKRRQPKAFYATPSVIKESNDRLTAIGSSVRLVPGPQTISIVYRIWPTQVLHQVTPTFNGGSADNLPQNCNDIRMKVIAGQSETTSNASDKAFKKAAKLAPTGTSAYRRAWTSTDDDLNNAINQIGREYSAAIAGTSPGNINQAARPNVGEAFVIRTVGTGPTLNNGLTRVYDNASQSNRDLGWQFHFGGVVARSGADYVTLENYARGDGRASQPDPRWYFQMYGEAPGQ